MLLLLGHNCKRSKKEAEEQPKANLESGSVRVC